jgi:DNA (cytosine-5)-methyltransferase 1
MIKVFECFAGYGGASWGLKFANIEYECVGFSEIKKSAIKCYETNFPNTKNFGDITLINWREVPDFDLLTGGFPCQDVSTQGKQDLSIGRTILINNLIEALQIKQPKYFLFENVSAIEQAKFKDFLLKVERDLRNAGYVVYRRLLKSCEHGSPQARERVFFIGFRKDIAQPFGFNPYPDPRTDFVVANDILDKPGDVRKKSEIIKCGQWKESAFECRNNIIESRGFYPTLCCVDEERRLKLADGTLYKLSEKELFRLQGFFKDEINLDGLSYNQAIDLSGDGWDVNLIKQIFLKMGLKE